MKNVQDKNMCEGLLPEINQSINRQDLQVQSIQINSTNQSIKRQDLQVQSIQINSINQSITQATEHITTYLRQGDVRLHSLGEFARLGHRVVGLVRLIEGSGTVLAVIKRRFRFRKGNWHQGRAAIARPLWTLHVLWHRRTTFLKG